MLAVARQVALSEGLPIEFYLHSLEDGLPFAAQQFDLLVCALTLSHVPHLSHALEECARVVQPGGYLLITDFHPDHIRYGWRTAFVRDGVKYYLPTVGYTRRDYLEAITASGFVILQVLESLVGDMPEGMIPEEMRASTRISRSVWESLPSGPKISTRAAWHLFSQGKRGSKPETAIPSTIHVPFDRYR